jgi:HSP20 family protein
MLNVEQAMNEVMAVYRSLTGRPIESGRTELPPEVDPMAHVEARYKELVHLLQGRQMASSMQGRPTFAPPADVYELEREVRCEIELPGIPHDRIEVTIAGDWLIVKGERPAAANGAGRALTVERCDRPFQKVIALPRVARRDAVEAVVTDGVLCVTIPLDGHGSESREVRVVVQAG